ncbi:MAG: HisA/HisF-related TIM barrel protein, partial [Gammaproteobacteria bacterium]
IDGWSKLSRHDAVDLARKFEEDGVDAIIFTDIRRDGMMNGLNLEATVSFAQNLRIPVIASGGVTNLDDIRSLCAVENEGIVGAVTGRAIYEGTLDFGSAQTLADELSKPG